MSLYTVNFKRKKFITRYDMKGNVVETLEEMIEENIHDLPLVTAKHYADKTGGMVIAQFERTSDRKPMGRDRVKFEYQKNERRASPAPKKAAAPKKEAKSTEKVDYADLVNKMMENEE